MFANWRGFFAPPGISQKNIEEYGQLIQELFELEKWQQLRANRGWSHLYLGGSNFDDFLSQQELELSILLDELGLLNK